MTIEMGVWRIDEGTTRITASGFDDKEERLKQLIRKDISILGLNILVLGDEVITDYGSRIDIMGIDMEGKIYVIELKKDLTPRDVLAQTLDYGSWAVNLTYNQIKDIYERKSGGKSFEEAFSEHFDINPPEELNSDQLLLIVASQLDPCTERITRYLAEKYNVPINSIFFKYFKDGDREYLLRSWLNDPSSIKEPPDGREKWNGRDFYVNFGEGDHRAWQDAVKYGFISAGGGSWYIRTLRQLFIDARIFVNIPDGVGYVGVGIVTGLPLPAVEQQLTIDGEIKKFTELEFRSKKVHENLHDSDKSEYVVPIRWVKTRTIDKAIKEPGLFGNQNTVCKLRNKHTLERLIELFELEE